MSGSYAYAKDDVYAAIEDLRQDIKGLRVRLDRVLGMIPEEPLRRPMDKTDTPERRILVAVAEFYNLRDYELLQDTQNHAVTQPRFLAMYLVRELLGYSYPRCGKVLGNFHHTSIMYGCKITQKRRNADLHFNLEVERLIAKLLKRLPTSVEQKYFVLDKPACSAVV